MKATHSNRRSLAAVWPLPATTGAARNCYWNRVLRRNGLGLGGRAATSAAAHRNREKPMVHGTLGGLPTLSNEKKPASIFKMLRRIGNFRGWWPHRPATRSDSLRGLLVAANP